MEDANLIATLIPSDIKRFAQSGFQLKHNKNHYLRPTAAIPDGTSIRSREQTRRAEEADEPNYKYRYAHRIQLRLDKKLLDPANGYAFGTNEKWCDIQLGYRGVKGIGGHHFNITFDEQHRLILKVCSKHGMAVAYNGQAKNEVRHRFTWILDLKKEKGDWDVEICVPNKNGLAFKVKLATNRTCRLNTTQR